MRKYIMYFLINLTGIYLLFTACNTGNTRKSQIETATSVDTTDITKEDSDLKTIVKEYLASYNDIIRIDTSLTYKEKKINLTFRHYCMRDSALVIPSKYVSVYGMKEFITHNFQSTLKITSNGVSVLDTIIGKSFFNKCLFEELINRGVLLYPEFRCSNDHITIDYSVSVPLSDVGTNVTVYCDYLGKIEVKPECH